MANICQIGAGMIGQAMAIDLAENHNVREDEISKMLGVFFRIFVMKYRKNITFWHNNIYTNVKRNH